MNRYGETMDNNPLASLEIALMKVNEFSAKLQEEAVKEDAVNNTIVISGHARVIAIRARELAVAADRIASLASIKEQADYAVEQHAQKTEDFAAVLAKRKPGVPMKKKAPKIKETVPSVAETESFIAAISEAATEELFKSFLPKEKT